MFRFTSMMMPELSALLVYVCVCVRVTGMLMQRPVIPCDQSRQYLLCNWQAASLSSAYRTGETDREAGRWMDGKTARKTACVQLGSDSMQLQYLH